MPTIINVPGRRINGPNTTQELSLAAQYQGREAEAKIVSSDWDDASPWTLEFLFERSEDGGATWIDNGRTTFVSGSRTRSGGLPSIKVSTTLNTTHIRVTQVPSRTNIRVGWDVTLFD